MEYSSKDISAGLPPSLSLVGKNALVTGSSRGIGAQTALALAERGANVAIHYTSESSVSKAAEVASKIQALGRKTCLIRCDLEEPSCGTTIVPRALQGLETKTLDILINNAALRGPGNAEDGWDPATFDSVMRVNVRAPALMLAATLPHLSPKDNRIINISSVASRINFPGYGLYSASKGALDALTRTWAKEVAIKYHCTVNGVLVGPTATPDAPDSEARRGATEMMTAEKRFGTMQDVSDVVCWLASESSRW
jgi:3-oxoacyl-[acyl-carrier protein] reductase